MLICFSAIGNTIGVAFGWHSALFTRSSSVDRRLRVFPPIRPATGGVGLSDSQQEVAFVVTFACNIMYVWLGEYTGKQAGAFVAEPRGMPQMARLVALQFFTFIIFEGLCATG